MSTSVTIKHTYRFYANATATNVNVTVGTLLGAMGGIGTIANSTVASMCSTVRVHRVTIWPPVATTGATNAEVVWFTEGSNFVKDESKESSLPSGITLERPAVCRPPAHSLASFWVTSAAAAGVVFQITCGTGSIVDVLLEGTLGNNIGNLAVAGYAAVSLNVITYGRLDGVGGKFTPLGLPTTN